MLEIKINKEIRDYKETFFFGLNLRQCLFTALGIAAAVAVHFASVSYGLNMELSSWASILSAAPFIFLGFFKYNGMTPEKFMLVLFKYLLTPKHLLFKPTNMLMELVADSIEKNTKEEIPFYDEV